MIDLTHPVSLYKALPPGRLAVVPGASHAVPLEQPTLVADLIGQFPNSKDPPRACPTSILNATSIR